MHASKNSDDGFKTYLFTYRHRGAFWSMEVKATSPADAKERVSKMACAVYDGELVMKIAEPLGALARVVVWMRNLVQRREA
ncbi:hypothetical protein LLG90_13455 [Aromatoleum toluclasticum]|nr:hypothetical protein [Aromatoleum toluclasticum]